MIGNLFQRCEFLSWHLTVGLCYHDQEVEQLKALFVHHTVANLLTTVLNHAAILQHTYTLLLLKKFQKNLLALCHGSQAEVLTQEATHQLHLGMHHLAVGLDDVRGKNK